MQCVCCKCGMRDTENINSTICLTNSGSHEYHCFCCAQPPRKKCINCNMWHDLEPMETHGPCIGGALHVFVYTEPWPPFPDTTPLLPLRAMPIEEGNHINGHESPVQSKHRHCDEPPQLHEILEQNNNSHSDNETINLIDDDEPAQQPVEDTADVDIKPKMKPHWVSIADIQRWTHCYRCGLVRIQRSGWLRHAQLCAQDSKYSSRKFFIYLHSKAWCGALVHDVFWEKHSNPENGTCSICRRSRWNNVPLPYQPKPPPRKNEAILEKRRRTRMNMQRKKRRQTITNETAACNAPEGQPVRNVNRNSYR
ncbi:uncharacterized protein LOC6586437 [Drosophila mojavensis]|uniref:Uncharacterized protein n=1 Tax=Drosophila mojavensis TaxID=7230 RepID=B4L906_DROMO|nr:uncharacterized protein LOC6586437 [Drosophila mojavensis]EDW17181.1 uncharacterized protein Dmoj_GI16758 [Drosophila mojavensis]